MRVVMPPIAILCGGFGTRLRPLTDHTPKSMVMVAGKPFIFWQLELLKEKGFERVVLCIGHLGGEIRTAVQDGSRWGLKVKYSMDVPGQVGTVMAIKRAMPLLDRDFCTIYGDSYLECSYVNVVTKFRLEQQQALITTHKKQDYGLGMFIRDIFKDTDAFNIIDLYRDLDKKHMLCEVRMKDRFHEIGSLPGLTQLNEHLEKKYAIRSEDLSTLP